MSVITVTANAALDVTYYVRGFHPGRAYRVSSVIRKPGGKGLNVARAVRTLGLDPLATGFAGGPTGERILRELAREGIRARFVATSAESRSTIAIVDEETGTVTELRERGEPVSREESCEFLRLLEEICRGASFAGGMHTGWQSPEPATGPGNEDLHLMKRPDRSEPDLCEPGATRGVVVLSGSLRPGLTPDFYGKLVEVCRTYGCLTILDTAGDALRHGVASGPSVVKVNLAEAREFFESDCGGSAQVEEVARLAPGDRAFRYASRIASRGVETVVVSMGDQGAVMLWRNQAWSGNVRIDRVRNPVGSGDSMAGGMASALALGRGVLEAFRLGIACGAANALTETAGEFRLEDVGELLKRVEVRSHGSCNP